jgi:hypothetical protein
MPLSMVLFTNCLEGVFSATAGLPAYGVLGCSGHHGGIIRGPGLTVRKKFLYGTRSIEVAKSIVCHYGL